MESMESMECACSASVPSIVEEHERLRQDVPSWQEVEQPGDALEKV